MRTRSGSGRVGRKHARLGERLAASLHQRGGASILLLLLQGLLQACISAAAPPATCWQHACSKMRRGHGTILLQACSIQPLSLEPLEQHCRRLEQASLLHSPAASRRKQQACRISGNALGRGAALGRRNMARQGRARRSMHRHGKAGQGVAWRGVRLLGGIVGPVVARHPNRLPRTTHHLPRNRTQRRQ